MYCTGGIRCEKASAFMKSTGFSEVYQLKGGIHRYLEAFPDGGLFRGKNFVFDKRATMAPAVGSGEVVGACVQCTAPCEQLSGDTMYAAAQCLRCSAPDRSCRRRRRRVVVVIVVVLVAVAAAVVVVAAAYDDDCDDSCWCCCGGRLCCFVWQLHRVP
jgi:predicted sulfurtransferase